MGHEVLHWTDFSVPAPIVAYNKFMNGVDRMDQLRSTHVTQWGEKGYHGNLYVPVGFISYASVCNINEGKGNDFLMKIFFEF
jgi:hypothetical protein